MSKPDTSPTLLPRYISPRELSRASTLSPATLWRERQRGHLPEPVRLSPGRVGWPEDVILAWLASRERVV